MLGFTMQIYIMITKDYKRISQAEGRAAAQKNWMQYTAELEDPGRSLNPAAGPLRTLLRYLDMRAQGVKISSEYAK